MERLGKLVEWNDARGYGFIVAVDAPGQRYFVHVHEYRRMGRRPEVGELLRFVAERQPDGRWRAVDVARAATGRRRDRASPLTWLPPVLVALLGALLAWAAWHGRLPALLPMGLLAINAVTFVAYWIDKRAAQAQARRTPEATLHLLELLGGWPAAWLAQRLLRHKSRKENYRLVFLAAAFVNLAAMALFLIGEPIAA
jgi:uncharacterized membrane protein YsdA (DUF1294 family)/cold shock CspA family protein